MGGVLLIDHDRGLMDEISQALGEEGSFPPEVLPESSISMTNVIVGKKRNRKPAKPFNLSLL